jgi:hypothetical protein
VFHDSGKVIHLRNALVNQARDERSADKMRRAALTISDLAPGCLKPPSGLPRAHFASSNNGKSAGD